MVTLTGKIKKEHVEGSEVYAVGSLRVGVLNAEKIAVVVGSGKVELLVSSNCILVSSRRPLIVGYAYCGSALLLGGKSPIVVEYLRSGRVYARKAYIQRLKALESFLGELCAVGEVEVAGKTVFMDPHMYMNTVISLGEVGYAYRIPEGDGLYLSPEERPVTEG